jgi:hypothetical protein
MRIKPQTAPFKKTLTNFSHLRINKLLSYQTKMLRSELVVLPYWEQVVSGDNSNVELYSRLLGQPLQDRGTS